MLDNEPENSSLKGKKKQARLDYTSEDLVQCLHGLVSLRLSIRKAQKVGLRKIHKPRVPKMTIIRRADEYAKHCGYTSLQEMPASAREAVSLDDLRPFADLRHGGARRYFSDEQEHVMAMVVHGFAVYWKSVPVSSARTIMQQLAHVWGVKLREAQLSNHFVNDFVARHSFLKVRKGIVLDAKRRAAAFSLKPFFEHLEPKLKDIDPRLIANIDECGCVANGRGVSVISSAVAEVAHVGGSETLQPHITVATLVTAAGHLLRTLYVTGTRSDTRVAPHERDDGDAYVPSESGFVDGVIFSRFLKDFAVPAINEYRAQHGLTGQAFYLLVDGHASHLGDLKMVWELSDQHDIVLVLMPAHTSHLIQPLDRCFFGSFKAALKKRLAGLNVFLERLAVATRINVIAEVLRDVATRDGGAIIKASFCHAGFVPWNPSRCQERRAETLSPRFRYLDDGSMELVLPSDEGRALNVPEDSDAVVTTSRWVETKGGKRARETTTVRFLSSEKTAGILKQAISIMTGHANEAHAAQSPANPGRTFWSADDLQARAQEGRRAIKISINRLSKAEVAKVAVDLNIPLERAEKTARCQRMAFTRAELEAEIYQRSTEDIRAAIDAL